MTKVFQNTLLEDCMKTTFVCKTTNKLCE